MSSETARCVNCGETHAVEIVGGLRVIGCPAMLADGSQIFLDEAASRVARNEPMREKEARMDKSETWKCTSCGSSRLDGESLCPGTGQPHPIDRDVWPEFYATSEVAAVRDKHCIGFGADDPLTAIDKALVARTENALRDFEGRNDSDTAEALRLLDDDRRAFADGSCRETRVDAVRRMRGGWPAAERISAENAKLCEEHAEYVREAEIGTARRNAIARDAFDEGATARAFVAAAAALPCVHGRKREDGPCPPSAPPPSDAPPGIYSKAAPIVVCPPCAARRIMASEERDG